MLSGRIVKANTVKMERKAPLGLKAGRCVADSSHRFRCLAVGQATAARRAIHGADGGRLAYAVTWMRARPRCVGFEFTVGTSPITVTLLGRWVYGSSSGQHTVALYDSSGNALSGGAVTVYTSGQPSGQFLYVFALGARTHEAFLRKAETRASRGWPRVGRDGQCQRRNESGGKPPV